MDLINLIYYSPTHTTEKVIKAVGNSMDAKQINEYNITTNAISKIEIQNDSLTLIGIPVYSGRIPVNAAELIKEIEGKNTHAAIIAVYGNRHYDDALLELKDISEACGFNVIAAATFIGEHSFSTSEKPIAANRPDADDLHKAANFAQMISNKISALKDNTTPTKLDVPGNTPYKERSERSPMSPETISTNCDQCGICVEVCPTEAISLTQEIITDKELCTLCSACVKACPNDARIWDNPIIKGFNEKLHANCSDRKEPEVFV